VSLFTLVFIFILFCLATHRLSMLLVEEDGALGMFKTLRNWAGVKEVMVKRMNPLGQMIDVPTPTGDTLLSKILSCFYCCSIWVGMGFSVFFAYLVSTSPDVSLRPLYLPDVNVMGWVIGGEWFPLLLVWVTGYLSLSSAAIWLRDGK
jgi:hypothetical protein